MTGTRCILADTFVGSHPSLEFECDVETQHLEKCNCLLRTWWRRVLSISIFRLEDWNQMHFCQPILLTILTISCPHLKFESVLKVRCLANVTVSSEFGGIVFSQFGFSSWITGTRKFFANTYRWLSQQPQVHCSWNFKVSWKIRIQ